jgi:tRNA(Ile)-lysidine synthase
MPKSGTSRVPLWNLYPAFQDTLASLLKGKRPRVLAAVSGGPDSMALWDMLERWRRDDGGTLVIGHVDHGLRGRASRADAAFVAAEARRRGTRCRVIRAPVRAWAQRNGRGVEESARFLRYRALARLARQERCRAVLTGHHRDDQVETLFMNLVRGAGPSGLAAMVPDAGWPVPGAPRSLRLLRPLLGVGRDRILRYLSARRLRFRMDATNREPSFFRNRIRPVLRAWEKHRPGFFDRVARLARVQQDEEAFWRARVEHLARGLLRRRGSGLALDFNRFIKYHKSEQRRILRHKIGITHFEALERVRAFAASPEQRITFPGGWAEKSGRALVFYYADQSPDFSHRIPKGRRPGAAGLRSSTARSANGPQSLDRHRVPVPGKAVLPLGTGLDSTLWEVRTRLVRSLPRDWKRHRHRVYVDADRLEPGGLTWRAWRPGDRFRPLGLAGRKKLQDFFVDEKIPRAERYRVPLLARAGAIVWVVGRRLADAVKLTPATRRIVEIQARPARRRELERTGRVLKGPPGAFVRS